MEILYISTTMTETELKTLRQKLKVNKNYTAAGMTESTVKFHGLILDGLSHIDNVNIIALSGRSISNKYFKKILWKSKEEKVKSNLTYKYLATINLPIFKQIFNALQYMVNIKKWLMKNKNEEKVIIIDGAFVSVLPIVSMFSKCKKICIIADIYDYMANVNNNNNNNNNKLKAFRNLINNSYNKMDGYIFLTEQMNSLMNRNKKPYIIVEGIVDNNIKNDNINDKKNVNKKVIMYAGAINEKFGLKNLVNAFMQYDDKEAELWLYGDGTYVDTIIEQSKQDNRIKFMGVAENKKIVEEEKKASLLINPRQNLEEFNKYSFPSKNMEYLVSGTPMLGVKLSGIPEEYYQYMYTMENGDEQEILEKFKQILNYISLEDRIKLGQSAKEFVLKNKNSENQAKRIISLIESINNDKI